MLKISNLAKQFAGQPLFEAASFVVNAGEFAGIVGPNGSGKTTLLSIVAGSISADVGSVAVQPGARVAYLRQGHVQEASRAAAEAFPLAFAHVMAERRIDELSRALERSADQALEAAYADALAAVAGPHVDQIRAMWQALGLREVQPDEPLSALSGGEQTKLGLIELVAADADVLLLDEPTNNLDLPALEWLDEYLAAFQGAVLAVAHDRALLNDHATQIIELDVTTRRIEVFAGNYDEYASEKARRRDAQWAAYRRQEQHTQATLREIRSIKSTASRREHLTQNDFYRRKAKKVARRAVVLERRLRREIDSSERIEKPLSREYRVKAEMEHAQRSGDRMLSVNGASIEVAGTTLLRDVSLNIGWGECVALIGRNGSGKTTLLRTIVEEHPLARGEVRLSPSTRVGYLPQKEVTSETGTPLDAIRGATMLSETEARRFLHRFLFAGDSVFTPIDRLSYGERRRLALAQLVLSGANLLLLDEPTNHLDIPSREAFESALSVYDGAMLTVTHDRYFLDEFAERMLLLEDGLIHEG